MAGRDVVAEVVNTDGSNVNTHQVNKVFELLLPGLETLLRHSSTLGQRYNQTYNKCDDEIAHHYLALLELVSTIPPDL